MKLYNAMLFAGCVVMSAGFWSAVAAQCQPPTSTEIEAERADFFTQADADGNNALSTTEVSYFLDQKRKARSARLFTCLDANSDGQVSAEELAARPPWGGPPHGGPF